MLEADNTVRWLDIDQLRPGPYQTRKRFKPEALEELAQSIKTSGIVQPIIVRYRIKTGEYEIIAGERRWRAARLAKEEQVPVIVRKELSDEACLVLAIAENIQRESLDPIEQAASLKRMCDELSLTHADISEAIGKSRTYVTNTLRLLQLDERLQTLLIEGRIDAGHGKALLTAPEALRHKLAEQIIKRGWNVRQAERKAKEMKEQQGREGANTVSGRDPRLVRMEQLFTQHFACPVHIEYNEKTRKGGIEIQFNNLVVCQAILDQLGIDSGFI
jgi:ParB family chromosome partitioning protein